MSKKTLIASVAVATLVGAASAAESSDYPPASDPGTCYARVLIPEQINVQTEQVVDRPESTEIKLVPATYETVTEQVLVKEETKNIRVIPATYETVTEQVLVAPERIETTVVPAEYETYTEQVLIREAYTTWKPGNGLYGRATDASASSNGVSTGELLCRVEVPAEYETVTRTRLLSPERTETRTIPATYETVTKEVVVEEAQVVEEIVPAVYNTVTVEKLVTPASEETLVVPATYKTIDKRVVSGGGTLEWREVLCDTNATSSKIRSVQQALSDAGYSNPVDGEFGPATLTAMESYQRSNNLPVGYLTISTVESLGLTKN
ncbi:MAG: peptidoglycan-binding protein [Hyphomonas sp.]|uniref:peptidoglycan-binding domain-containing protein n=1 Tax=Hyphomonas sp. TaxID=87 RepID=UPI001B22957D|nr:peptidoglycan-binding domain-containing protein [Hyphomonas sp.]MBO6581883.1 peptidoglycan-binding protein [Hyphomonas sp.]